jgi:hypothetical protein
MPTQAYEHLMLLRKAIDYTVVVSLEPVMAKPYSYHLGQKVMQAIEVDSLQKSLCQ